MDILILTRYIRGNTQFRRRTARTDQLLGQFIIPVRSLDKQLRLMLGINSSLQFLDRVRSLGSINRQITVKSETLSVKARSHHRHQDRRRPDQRYHRIILPLGDSHYVSTRISDRRTTRLRDHANALAFRKRSQLTRYKIP